MNSCLNWVIIVIKHKRKKLLQRNNLAVWKQLPFKKNQDFACSGQGIYDYLRRMDILFRRLASEGTITLRLSLFVIKCKIDNCVYLKVFSFFFFFLLWFHIVLDCAVICKGSNLTLLWIRLKINKLLFMVDKGVSLSFAVREKQNNTLSSPLKMNIVRIMPFMHYLKNWLNVL